MFKFTPHTLINKLIVEKILSDTCISCKSNENLPPLMCLYFENLNSRKSVWNRDVKTYLDFFSISRSLMRNAIHRRAMTRAVFVCLLKVNFWEFLLCRLCQSSSQFSNSRKNQGFLWSLTAALPIQKFVLNCCLLLFIVHQILTSYKKKKRSTDLGNSFLWLRMYFDQKLLEEEVHFTYYLQDALLYTTL